MLNKRLPKLNELGGTMAVEFLPKIETSKCTGCELCLKVCPNQVWAMVNNIAVVTNPEACDYIGACQEICPTYAISLLYEITFADEEPGAA